MIWLVLRSRTFARTNYQIDEAELGIGSQKIKIKPSYEDIQIAYKLWVELSTRKIGLPIDFEHDVIVEIYDSWYEFFTLTRDLIKGIPISRARRQDSTRKLIRLSIAVLNEGLRPHLTRWNARFRRWYQNESAKEGNELVSPQELQPHYPEFDKLRSEMEAVNKNLIKYRGEMRKLAFGE